MPSRCLDELAEGAPGSAVPSRPDRSLCEKRARLPVIRKGSRRLQRETDHPAVGQRLLDYLPRSFRWPDRRWRQNDRGFVVILYSQGTAILCRVGTHCGILAASVGGGMPEEDHSDELRRDSNDDESQEHSHASTNAGWFELAYSSDRQWCQLLLLELAAPGSVHTVGFVRPDECVEHVVLQLFLPRAGPLAIFVVSSALPSEVL